MRVLGRFPSPKYRPEMLRRPALVISAVVGSLLAIPAVASAAPDDLPVVLDSGLFSGESSALLLDEQGHPVVVYTETVRNELRLLRCNDPVCSGGDDIPIILDGGGGVAALYESLALDSSGNPVVSYYASSQGLRLLRCNDPSCSGGDDVPVTVDASAGRGLFTSLALDGEDNPVITYYESVVGDLLLLRCNDPACSGGDDLSVTLDSTGDVGPFSSVALDRSGSPVVSYYDLSNGDLRLMRCNDPGCSGGDDVPVTLDSAGDVGHSNQLVLDASGHPILSYTDVSSQQLRFLRCNDPACSGGDDVPVTLDIGGTIPGAPSLVLDTSGNPVIAHPDYTNGGVRLFRCDDPACSGGGEVSMLVDPNDGSDVEASSLALDATDNPVMTYAGGLRRSLRLLRCNDPVCAGDEAGPIATISLADGQGASTPQNSVRFEITFDEDVVGFDASDVAVSGSAGATSATVTGSGSSFVVTVSGVPGRGTVVVDLPAGVVTDAVGNLSQPAVVLRNSVTVVGSRELIGTHAGASGVEGSVARLYMAVFTRQPDDDGHMFWVGQAAAGLTMREIASLFITSEEFRRTYDALDDAAFVDLLYVNVMDRVGDPSGVRFWNRELADGVPRSVIVLQFSESPEFRQRTGSG